MKHYRKQPFFLCILMLVSFVMYGCSSNTGSDASPNDAEQSAPEDVDETTDEPSETVEDTTKDGATDATDDATPEDGMTDDGTTDAGTTDDGTTDDGDTDQLEWTAQNYCELTAEMFCEFYIRCDRVSVDSMDTCRSQFLETCNGVFEPRYVEYQKRGQLELSQAGVERCRSYLENVACDEHIEDLAPPCDEIWTGNVSAGETCAGGLGTMVCEEGTSCARDRGICGTCQETKGVNESCGDKTPCGDGLVCVNGTCTETVKRGESCSDTEPCGRGMSCIEGTCEPYETVDMSEACDGRQKRCPNDAVCLGGVCRKQARLGENCEPGLCASGFCRDGTCEPFKTSGQSCQRRRECLGGDCTDNSCESTIPACGT